MSNTLWDGKVMLVNMTKGTLYQMENFQKISQRELSLEMGLDYLRPQMDNLLLSLLTEMVTFLLFNLMIQIK